MFMFFGIDWSHMQDSQKHVRRLQDLSVPTFSKVLKTHSSSNSLRIYKPSGLRWGGELRTRLMQEPQIIIHDIPDEMHNMEVSVGVTRSLDGGNPVWSAPSRSCEVSFQGVPACSPLGPSITADGLTRVEMRWRHQWNNASPRMKHDRLSSTDETI